MSERKVEDSKATTGRREWRKPELKTFDAGMAELGGPGVSPPDFSTGS